MQETQVRSLGWEDPLEKGMTTQSSILAWRMPRLGSLSSYSPWGCKESDTTEQLAVSFSLASCFSLPSASHLFVFALSSASLLFLVLLLLIPLLRFFPPIAPWQESYLGSTSSWWPSLTYHICLRFHSQYSLILPNCIDTAYLFIYMHELFKRSDCIYTVATSIPSLECFWSCR